MKRRDGVLAAATLGVAAVCFSAIWPLLRTAGDSTVSQLPITWLDGTRGALSRWHGRRLLVNVWSPDCAPCRTELPLLAQYQQRQGAGGIEVIGLAMPASDPAAVRAGAAAAQVTYRLGWADATLLRALDVRVLPSSFWFDARGRLVARQEGPLDARQLAAAPATPIARR